MSFKVLTRVQEEALKAAAAQVRMTQEERDRKAAEDAAMKEAQIVAEELAKKELAEMKAARAAGAEAAEAVVAEVAQAAQQVYADDDDDDEAHAPAIGAAKQSAKAKGGMRSTGSAKASARAGAAAASSSRGGAVAVGPRAGELLTDTLWGQSGSGVTDGDEPGLAEQLAVGQGAVRSWQECPAQQGWQRHRQHSLPRAAGQLLILPN